jgi:hypothetical protein
MKKLLVPQFHWPPHPRRGQGWEKTKAGILKEQLIDKSVFAPFGGAGAFGKGAQRADRGGKIAGGNTGE